MSAETELPAAFDPREPDRPFEPREPERGEPRESYGFDRPPLDRPRTPPAARRSAAPPEPRDAEPPLLPEEVGDGLRRRWLDVQLGFVDDPRTSVEGADALLAEVVDELTRTLAKRQKELAGAWHDGTPDTDDLRRALLRYRPVIDAVLTR